MTENIAVKLKMGVVVWIHCSCVCLILAASISLHRWSMAVARGTSLEDMLNYVTNRAG